LDLGIDLEVATLRAALDAQGSLPRDAFVSLNVSPAIAMADGVLAGALERCSRPIVIELTEHDRVDDYGALREAIGKLNHVHVSIDDARAGFADLPHVL